MNTLNEGKREIRFRTDAEIEALAEDLYPVYPILIPDVEHWKLLITAHRTAFVKGYKSASQGVGEWKEVGKELPDGPGEYLTYDSKVDQQSVQYWDNKEWGYLASVKPDVTHWTPLPQPPKSK